MGKTYRKDYIHDASNNYKPTAKERVLRDGQKGASAMEKEEAHIQRRLHREDRHAVKAILNAVVRGEIDPEELEDDLEIDRRTSGWETW